MKVTFAEARQNRGEWVGHLREGNFAQRPGKLAGISYQDFCCLGVAEETVGKKFGIIRNYDGAYILSNDPNQSVAVSCLHNILREGMGLTPDQEASLIVLNDDLFATFEQISVIAEKMEYYCSDGVFTWKGGKIAEPLKEMEEAW
jgi:hypothetical protein